MTRPLHMHPCWRCQVPFECSGDLEFNYDGIPDILCVEFHEHGHNECEACAETAWCEDCGEHPATVSEAHSRTSLCLSCFTLVAVEAL